MSKKKFCHTESKKNKHTPSMKLKIDNRKKINHYKKSSVLDNDP